MHDSDIESSPTEFMKQYLGCSEPENGNSNFVSKAPIGVPEISPFRDWDYYFLRQPIQWVPDQKDADKFPSVEVPSGFVTDLASIPWFLWSVMPPTSRYTHAAIVHDYLYWTQTVSREMADDIFSIGMKELEVGKLKAGAIYLAVSKFGKGAWKANAELKQSGHSRFLREFPNDPRMSWRDFQQLPDVFL